MRLWHLPELFAIYIYNFNIHTYIYIYIHYLAFRDLSPPSRGHSKSLHWGACWTKANSCHILAHDVDMCAWSHMCAWSCCSDTLTMYQLVKQRRASPCRGLAFHEVVLLCSLSFSPVQSIITLSSFETAKHCALPARCKPLVKWPGAYRNVQDKTVHCKLPGPGTDRYGERERDALLAACFT
jgi:hypothetical protein